MMRTMLAALAGLAGLATPALAQVTYAPEAGPVLAPATVYVPHTRSVVRRVRVAHTHYVRRVVLVPRTRYVHRTLVVPVTTLVPRAALVAYPPVAYETTYPGTGLVGPTWVPPGTTYACRLGTVGCDSAVVGAMAF